MEIQHDPIYRMLTRGTHIKLPRKPSVSTPVVAPTGTPYIEALDFFGDGPRKEEAKPSPKKRKRGKAADPQGDPVQFEAVVEKKMKSKKGKKRPEEEDEDWRSGSDSQSECDSPSPKKLKHAADPQEDPVQFEAVVKKKKKSKKEKKRPEEEDEDVSADVELPGTDCDDHNEEEMQEPVMFSSSIPRRRLTRKQRMKRKEREVAALTDVEEANAVRKSHEIAVRGPDIPNCVESFQEMETLYKLRPLFLSNIRKSAYATPTPVQMQAIPLMMTHRELLVCAPTGSGKTSAFLLPILAQLKTPLRVGFRALVVAPTRELALQIHRELERLSDGSGFRCHVLTKATSLSFGPSSSKRFDILVSTPNRLVHLLEQDPPGVDLSGVQWLVLDEADKLFEKGQDSFESQISIILSACDHGQCCRSLFSATLGSGIEEWCQAHLDNYTRVVVGPRNAAAANIKQRWVFTGQEDGKKLEMRYMIGLGFNRPALLFVQSRERAKDLYRHLMYSKVCVDVIHAERTQAQRDSIISAFRAGKISILICTDLMGRGIDLMGVNMVINYDCPTSAVTYIHRIGRSGRAGRPGEAVTFLTEEDYANEGLPSIAGVMRASGCEVADWMLERRIRGKKVLKRKKRNRHSKKPVEREEAGPSLEYDLECARKRREMVSASKARKERKAEAS